ncbi:Flap endonuclease GEN 1 [Sparganum proliferum]
MVLTSVDQKIDSGEKICTENDTRDVSNDEDPREKTPETGGKSLAIDLSGWICSDIRVNERVQIRAKLYLRNLVFRIIALLKEAILPVAVTDGPAPALKASTLEIRENSRCKYNYSGHTASQSQRITSLERRRFAFISNRCCHLLKALGVPCLKSPGEAEAMCAYLDTHKLVDGCVSNDSDCFLYGASKVYRHFTLNSRNTSVVAYDAGKIHTDLGLSREHLVLLGLILGCDFWPDGVPGVGVVSARAFLSQNDPAVVRNHLKIDGSTPTVDMPTSVFQNGVWKKVKDGLCGCPVEEVFEEFLRPCDVRGWQLPSKSSIIWSQPNVKLAVEFCIQHLDWTPTYSLTHFIPLFAIWRLRLPAHSGENAPHEPTPIRIIRKRSINYILSYEVEWKRLSNDIWSENALLPPTSTDGEPAALPSAFFTQEGYKFIVPASELRLAFPDLVVTYESIGLLSISTGFKSLSLDSQKSKEARRMARTAKGATKKRTNHLTQVGSLSSGANETAETNSTTKTVGRRSFLLVWDSTPESSPQRKDRSPSSCVAALAVSFDDLPSNDTDKVEETSWHLPIRLNSAFERRLTLQSSLLSSPPSPSADQQDDFSCFPSKMATGSGIVWFQRTINLKPKPRGCHYVTEEIVKGFPEIGQIKIGTLHLFMQHTSSSITLNESWDASVKDDVEMLLNRLVPEGLNYKHSCEGPDDMPAHGKHAILGGSNVTVPITDGRMNLGTWQGLWFIEHRNHASSRKIIATLQGCKD